MKSNQFLKASVMMLWLSIITSLQAQDRIVIGAESSATKAPGDTLWVKPGGANSLLFSPDGKYLAGNSVEGAVILRDVHTGNAVDTLKGFDRILDFSPDNSTIATIGDGKIVLRNYHGNSVLKELTVEGSPYFISALFTQNGTIVVAPYITDISTPTQKQHVCAWEVSTGKLIWNKQQGASPSGENVFSVSQDGRFVALKTQRFLVANSPVDLIIRNGENGEVIESMVIEKSTTTPIRFSPDNRYLAVCRDSVVMLYSTETWESETLLTGKIGFLFELGFSPKGRFVLASGSFIEGVKVKGAIQSWDIPSEKVVFTHTPSVGYFTISPDSAMLALSDSKYYTSIITPTWTTTSIAPEIHYIQNFQSNPNPSVNTTLLSFTLLSIQQINLSLYSTDGKLIETLYTGMLQPGEHRFPWNVSSYPVSTYFARLTIGGTTQTLQLQRAAEGE